ncbi:MAG: hypothetical protein IJ545_08605 [Alphaproteobacteria bacterium]|nr:hypothetical protein [Alphaproteobacteria bacterium]
MMINVFLSLLCAGICSVFYRGIRFQKSLTCLGGGIFLMLLLDVYHSFLSGTNERYGFQWLSSRYYPVNIEFFANAEIYETFLLFLFSALLMMIYMIWDKYERQKFYVFALICFNLALLLMLICGQNTIQVLISACFIDIFGFCLINNIPARRQYIFYTLLADMALYVACAMLWGSFRTNIISEIADREIDSNNYALWLIAIATFIKSGLVPFQGYLMPTDALSISRRNVLYFLSTPVVGFLVFWKMYPILKAHFIWFDSFSYIASASLFIGAGSILVIKKLEIKKIYMNMIFYSFAYMMLLFYGDTALNFKILGSLFILQIAVHNGLEETKKKYGLVCLLSIMQMCAVIMVCGKVDHTLLQPLYLLYLSAMILGIGGLIYEISLSENEINNKWSLLLSVMIVISIIYISRNIPENFYTVLALYIILIAIKPYRLFTRLYDSDRVQTFQGFSGLLYYIGAGPFLFLGRILWLTVDFLIIERTLLNSLARGNEILSRIFKWLHQPRLRNVILFIMLGGAIMAYSIWGTK